jgi:hypothetical protein
MYLGAHIEHGLFIVTRSEYSINGNQGFGSLIMRAEIRQSLVTLLHESTFRGTFLGRSSATNGIGAELVSSLLGNNLQVALPNSSYPCGHAMWVFGRPV